MRRLIMFMRLSTEPIVTKGEYYTLKESQYNQVADVLNRYLAMEKDYVNNCLKLNQVSFGAAERYPL